MKKFICISTRNGHYRNQIVHNVQTSELRRTFYSFGTAFNGRHKLYAHFKMALYKLSEYSDICVW